MEAFLKSCLAAVPDDSLASKAELNARRAQKKPLSSAPSERFDISLREGLSGFMAVGGTNGAWENRAPTMMMRPLSKSQSSSSSFKVHCPQFETNELATRLELYLRNLNRAHSLGQPCVVYLEPSKATRARNRCIVRSFVATVGCVSEIGPTLMVLISALTKELLAVDSLGDGLIKVVRSKSANQMCCVWIMFLHFRHSHNSRTYIGV